MKEALKQDLQSLTLEGNIAKLPTEPLNNYADLKKALIKACGKYKKNTFEFPYSAIDVIEKLLNGENTNFKKEFQFFATPQDLARFAAQYIIFDKSVINICEPGAGHGALIDAVLELNQDVQKNIDAVELSELNWDFLTDKYMDFDNVNVIKGDFLKFEPNKKYDLIFANPPFTNNQDIDHIKKMYSLLADNGQLITIASSSWTFGTQRKQTEFKEWVEELGTYQDLKKGSFKSSGTNVSGVLITIYK